ncbi:hypothetical protein J3998_11365 [Thiomicrorhabdus sp. 6S2-11]|uniref:Uncharacterized protein n=1 Tax=Thiomicrorhabdus marina TaxID=2818442 RepID=A0ABS3Q737_9GAMM|nr:hypothetical protein [Thiomicrorhabdus marina]MBO1928174.1 hypothetical protein [Thiomicrorhabdus marina]
MSTKASIQDYQLQAYVDNQLGVEERLELEQLMAEDSEIERQVQQLSTLKSQLKQAYADVSVPPQNLHQNAPKSFWSVPKSAAAALLLGVLIGSSFSTLNSNQAANSALVAQAAQSEKFIIHVDTDDQIKQFAAVQKIADLYQQKGEQIQVDVITNSEGVRLFDVNNASSEELATLLDKYPKLTLFACQRALQRASDKGEKINLIPQVQHDKPAVDAMAERLNSGWNYIKI